MGRKEFNDYVIYKIVCLSNPDLVYVGSTANFYARRRDHKSSCNNPNDLKHNVKKYVTIRENGGWENWNMIIIDELKQITLIKSRQIEEEYRVKLNANLNSNKCLTSCEERKEYKKEYYENNKAHIKEYLENNKEKRKELKKVYYDANKEKFKEKSKAYYQENNEEVVCECGCISSKKHIARHKQSAKHIKLITALQILN